MFTVIDGLDDIRAENFNISLRGEELLRDAEVTTLALAAIWQERNPLARQIARTHAMELCLRLNRKLTECEGMISRIIALVTREYSNLVTESDAEQYR